MSRGITCCMGHNYIGGEEVGRLRVHGQDENVGERERGRERGKTEGETSKERKPGRHRGIEAVKKSVGQISAWELQTVAARAA